MTDRSAPPELARRILERAVPTHMRSDVSGDMDELFRARVRRSGRWRASLWYSLQAVSFTIRFFLDRLHPSDYELLAKPHRSVMKTFSWLDWKLGARMLVKYPGLSLISVVALAMAIGVGVGIFYAIDRQSNPRMPFRDGDRLVTIGTWNALSSTEEGRILSDVAVWRKELESIETIGAYRTLDRNLTGDDGRALPVRAAEISASMFAVTGVKPILGRELTAADEQVNGPAVAVLSYDVWQDRFNGDRSIVGRTIQLGYEKATVVGVMPERFSFPRIQQLWTPLRERATAPLQGPSVSVFGRLAKGATLATARAEIAVIGSNLAKADPATHAHLQPEVRKFGVERGNEHPGIMVVVLYLSTFMVLFATCANVATLVFARTAMRESEIVVRNALGASRRRVMAQLFVEALVLSLVAGAIGLVLFTGFLRFVHYQMVVVRAVPQPFWVTYRVSFGMALQALMFAVIGATIVGFLPAIKATGSRVQNALQSIRGGGSMKFGGVWSAIIVMQVALTVLTLPVGMAATRKAMRDHKVRSQFPSADYVTFKSGLEHEAVATTGDSSTAHERARTNVAYTELLRRLRTEPGVEAVTFADRLPGMNHPVYRIEAQRGAESPVLVSTNMDGYAAAAYVDVGFFDAFRVPLLSGRQFTNGDVGAIRKTVIINESLAKNIGGNPLGVRVRYVAENDATPADWFEVVGVIKNMGMDPKEQGDLDFIFIASAASDIPEPAVAVRLKGDAAGFAQRLPTITSQVDAGLRVSDVLGLDEVVRRRDLPGIISSVGGVALAALAVMLSAACLFALMSVSVAKRTREIGVRLALGASSSGVLRSIFARSAAQVGTGIVIGNVAMLALTAWFSNGIRPDVIVPVLGVSLVMVFVGVCACAIPALRVLRVRPTEALREAA